MGANVTAPKVSVIMSVYNGARDAPAAIDCILKQSFSDFELIVINNGSHNDATADVLARIATERADSRLRLMTLPENIGLAGALNHGIALARGIYIARQDHDDISKPERFAAQVDYMDRHPACGLLGTRAEIWRGGKRRDVNHDHALTAAELSFDLLFNNPFVHSSVMIRKSVLDDVGVYTTDPARQPPEDYELWSRIALKYDVANLAERHLIYNEMPGSMSRDPANPFLQRLVRIGAENLAAWTERASDDRLCFEIAQTMHGLFEENMNADAACHLVAEAGQAIMARYPHHDLGQRIASACATLRHHHARGGVPARDHRMVSFLRHLPMPTHMRALGRRVLAHARRG